MISKLHYITQGNIEGKSHQELAELACKGGVDWVQLRVKDTPYIEWKTIALETREICDRYGAKLIINDNPKLAVEVGADGVHVGKEDMPLGEVRKLIGDTMILGATTNTIEDIVDASQFKVDYVGLGPYRFTSTKDKLSPVIGLNGFYEIRQRMKKKEIEIPVIAIGGILIDDIQEVFSVGVHGVAIASAINAGSDPTQAAMDYCREVN